MKNIFVLLTVLMSIIFFNNLSFAQLRTPSPNAPYCQVQSYKGIAPVVENDAALTFYYLKKSADKPYPERQETTKMVWVQPGGKVKPHTLNNVEELVYFFEGKGSITVNGTKHEVHPGTAVFIPPGIERSYENPAKDEGGFDNWLKFVSVTAGCSPPAGGEIATIRAVEDTIPVVAYFAGLDWRLHLKWDPNSKYPENLFFASRAILTPGLSFNAHMHEDHEETYFILRGHGHMELDNVRYEIGPMTNVFFPPGVDHEIINDSDEVMDIFAWGVHVNKVPVFGTRTVPQPAGSFPLRKKK